MKNKINCTRDEAAALIHENALVLDVRGPDEFASGAYPGAVNIPVAELEKRLGELEPKDRPILVYCASGMRSRRAAEILKSAGWLRAFCPGGLRDMP